MWKAFDDEPALARAWRAARPFPHLVLDDVLAEADVRRLLAILDEEPVETRRADLYELDASDPEPRTTALRELRDAFAAALGPSVSRISGRRCTRVDMRAFAYRSGHYLLPHTDHQESVGRQVAYVYYVPSPEPPVVGELELFEGFASARVVEPRGNRLVLFDVSDASLHQVREVLAGLRISLAGWFYP